MRLRAAIAQQADVERAVERSVRYSCASSFGEAVGADEHRCRRLSLAVARRLSPVPDPASPRPGAASSTTDSTCSAASSSLFRHITTIGAAQHLWHCRWRRTVASRAVSSVSPVEPFGQPNPLFDLFYGCLPVSFGICCRKDLESCVSCAF